LRELRKIDARGQRGLSERGGKRGAGFGKHLYLAIFDSDDDGGWWVEVDGWVGAKR